MSEAWGRGLATVTAGGRVLDVLYPDPVLGLEGAPEGPGTTVIEEGTPDDRRGTKTLTVVTVLDNLDSAPTDAYDAYLRLHLLSSRLVAPHGLNLDGIFGVLPNVAWTSHGPVDPADLPAVRMRFRIAGEPLVGFASPSSSRISVVLPAPLGPRKPKAQPRGTSRSMCSRAARSPKRFPRPWVWMARSVMAAKLRPGRVRAYRPGE